jgi:hypothetical protein
MQLLLVQTCPAKNMHAMYTLPSFAIPSLSREETFQKANKLRQHSFAKPVTVALLASSFQKHLEA